MARKLIPQQYDTFSDLSGEKLPQDGWTHVKMVYTVDGDVTRLELDLSLTEEQTLRAILSEYIDAAKTAGNLSTGAGQATASGDKSATKRMRDWAIATAKAAKGTYVITLDGDTEPTELKAPAAQGRLDARWIAAFHQVNTPKDEQTEDAHASEAVLNAAMDAGEKAAKGK